MNHYRVNKRPVDTIFAALTGVLGEVRFLIVGVAIRCMKNFLKEFAGSLL